MNDYEKLSKDDPTSLFFSRIDEIITQKDMILSDSKLFNFRLDDWVLHIQYTPKYLLCLGQLIILWQSKQWASHERIKYFPNGENHPEKYRDNLKGLYFFNHGGFLPSGNSWTKGCYADDLAIVVYKHHHGGMLQSYREVADQYQYEADKTNLKHVDEFFSYFDHVKNL